jgi:NAD(P)-dependent dehydrogenase (short-subunit alcohol dehydrogenase family)
LDLANPQAIADWGFSEITSLRGRVIVVLNAAVVEPTQSFLRAPAPDFVRNAVTNFVGPFLFLQKVMLNLDPSVDLTVAYVSTGAVHVAIPGLTAYSASKAAGNVMIRGLVAENDRPGTRFLIISPGLVETGMQKSLRDAHDFPSREVFVEYARTQAPRAPEAVAQRLIETCQNAANHLNGAEISLFPPAEP